ncbi:MAG TPA: hypothetical protein PLB25_10215 [Rhodoferax sp.]|nr:hypothetical protein [Rhodoferax sp.]
MSVLNWVKAVVEHQLTFLLVGAAGSMQAATPTVAAINTSYGVFL